MRYDVEGNAREFLDRTLPSNAGSIQRDEMLKAYMAGFIACFGFCQGASEFEEEEGVEAIEHVHRQLAAWIENLGARTRRAKAHTN